eukprot:768478-Hanusia_phi.AAC.19
MLSIVRSGPSRPPGPRAVAGPAGTGTMLEFLAGREVVAPDLPPASSSFPTPSRRRAVARPWLAAGWRGSDRLAEAAAEL